MKRGEKGFAGKRLARAKCQARACKREQWSGVALGTVYTGEGVSGMK